MELTYVVAQPIILCLYSRMCNFRALLCESGIEIGGRNHFSKVRLFMTLISVTIGILHH